jgi:hypothetical protein
MNCNAVVVFVELDMGAHNETVKRHDTKEVTKQV